MAWSAAFLEQLQTSTVRLFRMEVVKLWEEPGTEGFSIASHYGLGGDDSARISGIETAGQTLKPQSWTSEVGEFGVLVAGVPSDLLRNVTRGTSIQVTMGFPGWKPSAFEAILLGRVKGISRVGATNAWRVTCLDAFSALSYRMSVTATQGLFGGMGHTLLTADAAIGDSTYNGTIFSDFERESGAHGAVLATPGSGEAYYRKWSASTGTTLTIASPATVTVMDTDDVGAESGDTVAEVAYLKGHPIEIARKVLTSRGAAANGPYDVYPASWGLGVGQQFLDDVDIDQWLSVVQPGSGSYEIEIAQTAGVDNAKDWLEGTVLAPFGCFLAMRQGMLTIRAAQDPTDPDAYATGFHLTLADVVSDADGVPSIAWEAYDPDVDTEYSGLVGIYRGGSVTSTLTIPATLPAKDTVVIDVSTCVFSNGVAIVTELQSRLGVYYTRIPEYLRVKCRLRAAQLAVGDLITVTLGPPWVYSRRDVPAGYDGRRAVVTQVEPDYWQGFCTLELRIYPDTEDQWG